MEELRAFFLPERAEVLVSRHVSRSDFVLHQGKLYFGTSYFQFDRYIDQIFVSNSKIFARCNGEIYCTENCGEEFGELEFPGKIAKILSRSHVWFEGRDFNIDAVFLTTDGKLLYEAVDRFQLQEIAFPYKIKDVINSNLVLGVDGEITYCSKDLLDATHFIHYDAKADQIITPLIQESRNKQSLVYLGLDNGIKRLKFPKQDEISDLQPLAEPLTCKRFTSKVSHLLSVSGQVYTLRGDKLTRLVISDWCITQIAICRTLELYLDEKGDIYGVTSESLLARSANAYNSKVRPELLNKFEHLPLSFQVKQILYSPNSVYVVAKNGALYKTIIVSRLDKNTQWERVSVEY